MQSLLQTLISGLLTLTGGVVGQWMTFWRERQPSLTISAALQPSMSGPARLCSIVTNVEPSCDKAIPQSDLWGRSSANFGMVQKRLFSGNTRDLGADRDRSRGGVGLRESLAALLGLQLSENRLYPRSSSQ